MKTKIKLMTIALLTIFICPTKTVCMLPFLLKFSGRLIHRGRQILIRGRGGICRPPTGDLLASKLRKRSASQQPKCKPQDINVVKLGGKVICPNESFDYPVIESMEGQMVIYPNETFDYHAMESMGGQIADYFLDDPEGEAIFVTGAGAPAHKNAHKHKENLSDALPLLWGQTREVENKMVEITNKHLRKHHIPKLAVSLNSRKYVWEAR